ncbi:hypothetical protein ACHAPF_010438, partial [Botrytis cinerea]
MPRGRRYSAKCHVTSEDEVHEMRIEIMPRKLDNLKRMVIHAQTTSGKTISLTLPINCTVKTLYKKNENLTGIPFSEQRIIIDGKRVSFAKMFIIQDSDVCSRFRVPGLNSNASRQYMEQVPGEQRHLQEVAAVEDTGKRTVKRNDGTHDVFIEQIIVEDFVPADQWDTENIAIFNLQTVSAAAVEGTIGIKPPRTIVS